MPGRYHEPWCTCGWCFKEREEQNIFGFSNFHNSISTNRSVPTSTILTTTQAGKSRTYPTECPWQCGETVYYHTNGYGDSVYFDWLGSPWQIHGCFESYWKEEQERKKLLGSLLEHQHIMSPHVNESDRRQRLLRGAIDRIKGDVTEEAIATNMGLLSESDLRGCLESS